MSDADSRLPIWPFLAADALFLAVAGLLLRLGHRPLLWWEALFMVACVAGAAVGVAEVLEHALIASTGIAAKVMRRNPLLPIGLPSLIPSDISVPSDAIDWWE